MSSRTLVFLGAAALLLAGCHPAAPAGALVLTQTPVGSPTAPAATVMDVRYPPGSRVVLLVPPFSTTTVRELSHGLAAAGAPCVSWDGRVVYFAGKSASVSDWQIYRVDAGGGQPELVTRMPGGAMDPAVAAHGELVFSSPVPKAGRLWTTPEPSALYGQMPGQAPRRITFGPNSSVGPTVLRDGRILFVTVEVSDDTQSPKHLGLFTINNDGTEVTAYACQGDGMDYVMRPRELGDGRIAFVAARSEEPEVKGGAECVKPAAPFATRSSLFAFKGSGCRSVEPFSEGDILACIETSGWVERSMTNHAAVFRVAAGDTAMGAPLFDDPQWNSIEAAPVGARVEPGGHTSVIVEGLPYGTLFCLNVNDSSDPAANHNLAPAASLRVSALIGAGQQRTLGQVPVDSDGSVIVQLPAEVPLGLDTLDAQGNLLRRQPALLWLRPGENRACIGCHEQRNHAPRNIRPLATMHKPVRLDFNSPTTAPHNATP